MGGMNSPSCMSPSGCARGWVQMWQPKLPPSPGQRRWCPAPRDACILKSPHPTIYTPRWLLHCFHWKQLHTKAQGHCWWRREDRDAPGGTLVTWVTAPGSGRKASLPKYWLPGHAQRGENLPPGGKWRAVAAGSSFLSARLTIVWAM